MIFSASRRTDIPAFYGDWFLARLRGGDIAVRNPMSPHRVTRFLFDADAVDCIVFWTKNPVPFIEHLSEIDELGYKYYFQFTITPYGHDIERNIDKANLLDTFIKLSEKIGKGRVIWRYDPIIINNKYSMDYHIEKFALLAEKLHSYTEKCVISFVDRYPFLSGAFSTMQVKEFSKDMMFTFARKMNNIANSFIPPLRIATCSERIDLSSLGIEHNCCIDSHLISGIGGKSLAYRKDPSQRLECGCAVSRDIGTYNTCFHDCQYCYAKRGRIPVEPVDPSSPMLCSHISGSDTVKTLDIRTQGTRLKYEQ